MSGVKGQKKCPEPEPQCQDPCEPVVQVIEQKCPSPQACVPEPLCPQPQSCAPVQVCPQPQACVPEPVCPQPQEVCTQSNQKKDNIGVKK